MGIDADELRKLLQEAGLDAEAGVEANSLSAPGAWGEAGDQAEDRPGATPQAETPPNLRRSTASSGDDAPPTNAAIYFRDISSVELLTAEEEIELAQQIEAGEDARRDLRHPELSDERRDELQHLTTIGERARSRLTEPRQ